VPVKVFPTLKDSKSIAPIAGNQGGIGCLWHNARNYTGNLYR